MRRPVMCWQVTLDPRTKENHGSRDWRYIRRSPVKSSNACPAVHITPPTDLAGFHRTFLEISIVYLIIENEDLYSPFEEICPIFATLTMASEDARNLINRLREVVGKERGSQSELARKLGASRQRLNDWLNLKSTPSLDDGLKIQAFLQKQHRQSDESGHLRTQCA